MTIKLFVIKMPLLTVRRAGLWMSLSVVDAVLASTVQRQASLQSLEPACQVKNLTSYASALHNLTWYKCLAFQTFYENLSPQVSTVSRGPILPLQCQVYLVVFVQQATIVPRAALCPHPARLALTKMRSEEKAKITAKHARLVSRMKTLYKYNFYQLTLYCTKSLVLSKDFMTVWMSLPGSFQDVAGQKECNPCPPGFHCQSPSPSATRGSSTGVSSPLPCPAGYICPRESQPVPCPKGTYSPSHGLTSTGKNPLWKNTNNGIKLRNCLALFYFFK